ASRAGGVVGFLAFVLVVVMLTFEITGVRMPAAPACPVSASVGGSAPGWAASAQILNQLAGNLFKEAGGDAHLRCVVAVAAPVVRTCEDEGVHGARHAHIAETALLFEFFRIGERARMRK